MSALIISRHKRFAVRHEVLLRNFQGSACRALLIELSQKGCRVSVSPHEHLAADQPVTIEVAGFGDIHGRVFSSNGTIHGIRFVSPIASAALNELVGTQRDEPLPILQLPAFGIRFASAQ